MLLHTLGLFLFKDFVSRHGVINVTCYNDPSFEGCQWH